MKLIKIELPYMIYFSKKKRKEREIRRRRTTPYNHSKNYWNFWKNNITLFIIIKNSVVGKLFWRIAFI